MARKTKQASIKMNYPAKPLYKWVKRANMWCKTWFEEDNNGAFKQKQEWMTREQYEAKNG